MLLPRHPRVLVAVCIGYFMAVLDSTVVNVALPDMAGGLAPGFAGMQWVGDGYALWFASLLLTAGALGDRLGNRGTFIAGLALFTLASGLCGIAPSLGALVAFRALQGVGAAVQVPPSLALLRHAYHDPAERAQAIGIWAAAGVLFHLGDGRAPHPMLPPALFRDPTFSAANAVGAILSFGFYGELFLMSLFFQQVQHRSPLATGLALLPQTAVISLMNFVSGQITARRGPRLPMVLGLGIGGSGLVGLAFLDAHAPLLSAVGPMLAMGVGASLAMPAMTHAAIDHTPQERAGTRSAVLNARRPDGGG